MEDFDGWVKILIGIFAAVVCAFNGVVKEKKKGKEEETAAAEAQVQRETELRKISELTKSQTQTPSVAEAKVAAANKSNPLKNGMPGDLYDDSRENLSSPILNQQYTAGPSEYAFSDADDIRRAVIYSEILNRKY